MPRRSRTRIGGVFIVLLVVGCLFGAQQALGTHLEATWTRVSPATVLPGSTVEWNVNIAANRVVDDGPVVDTTINFHGLTIFPNIPTMGFTTESITPGAGATCQPNDPPIHPNPAKTVYGTCTLPAGLDHMSINVKLRAPQTYVYSNSNVFGEGFVLLAEREVGTSLSGNWSPPVVVRSAGGPSVIDTITTDAQAPTNNRVTKGQSMTVPFRVKNSGSGVATDVILRLDTQGDSTITSVSPGTLLVGADTDTAYANVGDIGPGATKTVQVTVRGV